MPKAVDTNVVLRFILRDDPVQAAIAEALFRQPIFVPATVLIETAWVLESRYGMTDTRIAEALRGLIDLPNVAIAEPELTAWALERFRAGADLADMIHLVGSRHVEAFATFDRGVARAAGADAPVPVETLKA